MQSETFVSQCTNSQKGSTNLVTLSLLSYYYLTILGYFFMSPGTLFSCSKKGPNITVSEVDLLGIFKNSRQVSLRFIALLHLSNLTAAIGNILQ